MKLTRLATYPIKSLGGRTQAEATMTHVGLAGDRRWVVLDAHGNRVSARDCRALLGLAATTTTDGLRIADRGGDAIDVRVPGADAPRVPTRMSRIEELVSADEAASEWISSRVGRSLRLAHQPDSLRRPVGAEHGGRPEDVMSLADTAPIHLVTEVSIDRLRDLVAEESGEPWLDRESAIERMRANLVVDGDAAFAEDEWRLLRIGTVTYRFSELCDRCVLTTIDRDTLETTKEPIRTLARHRRWDGQTWFGIRLIPDLAAGESAHIAVGDEVEVLQT